MNARPFLSEGYRSMPTTPYAVDPRQFSGQDVTTSFEHASRLSHLEPDYFTGYGSYPRPRSPFGPVPNESEVYGMPPLMPIDELVRRTNLAAALANHLLSSRSLYSQLHPMMCKDGSFPADFKTPRTVEDFKLLDSETLGSRIDSLILIRVATQLDRILQSYRLPYDARALMGLHPRDSPPSGDHLRKHKLWVLYDFLGAGRLVDPQHERDQRTRRPLLNYV
ncbi:MAG: hypothetical protein M1834_002109 [Cirrosporium novae-zelandiae]|nr:MAG: hypothetical protein M1834_002109 [Cirrosporium novae-zelandiae]